jgi:hypothetical protein
MKIAAERVIFGGLEPENSRPFPQDGILAL